MSEGQELASYWWWVARTPCSPFAGVEHRLLESCYVIPLRSTEGRNLSLDMPTALTEGRLLTKSGVKKPRRPRPGEMLMYGNILYAGSYADAVLAQQSRLLPIEQVARQVLRGANNRSAAEIGSAFRSLGLGTYHQGNPLVRQLVKKGVVKFDGGRLYLRNGMGQEVTRPGPTAAAPHAPDRDLWDLGHMTEANILQAHEWHDLIDWPRAGRPKGVKNKLPPIRRGRLDFGPKEDR